MKFDFDGMFGPTRESLWYTKCGPNEKQERLLEGGWKHLLGTLSRLKCALFYHPEIYRINNKIFERKGSRPSRHLIAQS